MPAAGGKAAPVVRGGARELLQDQSIDERYQMSFSTNRLALALVIPLGLSALHAQDARTVTEPTYPQPCVTLAAPFTAPNGVLPESAEKNPASALIQAAIDRCGAGGAVVLAASGAHNIFLSGPLHFRAGVTLLVQGGAALFASRNPRDYDVQPGSCGIGFGCARGRMQALPHRRKRARSRHHGRRLYRWPRRRPTAGPEGHVVGSRP